ncbi:MAG: PEP-CTERM sorting domain-containing protein [Minisyncoccia bacterium]
MKKTFFASLILAASSLIVTANAAVVQSMDFSSPVTTGATQAPGTWYTDRYAPDAFYTTGGELIQTISSNDSASNRPAGFASAFYNTQGRKYDVDVSTTEISVDLYVDSDWATMSQRIAGIWGTAYDDANVITSYPILEFGSNGSVGSFQGWNNGTWSNFGLPVGFAYNTMHNLSIELVGGLWDYSLDGLLLGSVDANGSTHIGNVILQGYNAYGANDVASHNIRWDNFAAQNNVPEPGTLPLALAAAAGVIGFGRRNKTTV